MKNITSLLEKETKIAAPVTGPEVLIKLKREMLAAAHKSAQLGLGVNFDGIRKLDRMIEEACVKMPDSWHLDRMASKFEEVTYDNSEVTEFVTYKELTKMHTRFIWLLNNIRGASSALGVRYALMEPNQEPKKIAKVRITAASREIHLYNLRQVIHDEVEMSRDAKKANVPIIPMDVLDKMNEARELSPECKLYMLFLPQWEPMELQLDPYILAECRGKTFEIGKWDGDMYFLQEYILKV